MLHEIATKIRHFLYGYNIKFVNPGYNTDFLNEKIENVEFEGQINYIGKSPFDYEIKEILITNIKFEGETLSDKEIKIINQNI